MAEALGFASSVLGIVSRAGQICSGIQCLYAFIDSVKDTEPDLQRIRDELEIVEVFVHCLRQDSTTDDVPDKMILQRSLALCMSRIQRLQSIIGMGDDRKDSLRRSISMAFKKQRIAEFVNEFDGAKMTLMLAYQQYALQRFSSASFFDTAAEQIANGVLRKIPSTVYDGSQYILDDSGALANRETSRSIITSVSEASTYHLWLAKLIIRRCSICSVYLNQSKEILKKWTFLLQLAKWKRIELEAVRRWGHWTYQLRALHMVDEDCLLFQFCQEGDLTNIRRLFDRRMASPFDVAPDGRTALHFAASNGQVSLVRFLLQAGADPNVENDQGQSAFHQALISPDEAKHLQLARLFVEQGQVDPMGTAITYTYRGSLQAFKYLIHQDQFFIDPEQRASNGRKILQNQLFYRILYSTSLEYVQTLFAAGHRIPPSSIEGDDPLYEQFPGIHHEVNKWAWEDTFTDDSSWKQKAFADCSKESLEHALTRSVPILRILLAMEDAETKKASTTAQYSSPLVVFGDLLTLHSADLALSPDQVDTHMTALFAKYFQFIENGGHDVFDYFVREAELEEMGPMDQAKSRLDIQLNHETRKVQIKYVPRQSSRSPDIYQPVGSIGSGTARIVGDDVMTPNTKSLHVPIISALPYFGKFDLGTVRWFAFILGLVIFIMICT